MTWSTIKLGDLCEVVSGATPKTAEQAYWNGDVLWATPTDLSGLKKKCIANTDRKITTEGLASCAAKVLPINSVLFTSRAPIGLVAINAAPMATNQGFKSFIPNQNKLDSSYLYWWLRVNRERINAMGVGATFKEVSKSIVERIEIPLPPLAEQKRIAAILDKAAEIKAKREQAIARFDDVIASVFDSIQSAEDFEAKCTIKELTKKISHTPVEDESVWSLSLEQIDANTGGINEIVNVKRSKLGSSTYFFTPPVVLYSKLRPYLNKVALPEHEGFATTELVPLYCDESKVLPEYLATYLRSSKFVEFASINSAGAKMPRVMMDKFWAHEIKLPNLTKQIKFVEIYKQCKKQKQAHIHATEILDELTASLQHQAFSTGFAA